MAMTPEHKAALKQGRAEARAIKAYLNAIEARRPGRPVTRESLERRVVAVEAKIEASGDQLERLELVQRRMDLEEDLAKIEEAGRLEDLESGFLEHARSYSERKGISYPAWREMGVSAATLRVAGIPETRRR